MRPFSHQRMMLSHDDEILWVLLSNKREFSSHRSFGFVLFVTR